MKSINYFVIGLFFVIVLIPLVCFNTTPNSISVIDNRKLTENPFSLNGDLTSNIQKYVNDRIGFRDDIITAYTVLNDRLFGKMVHPSYIYGKDGYVFGAGVTTTNGFGDFHIIFADMIAKIQSYCDERNVPFLFVFNPAKPAVYVDKIADGIKYNREWVDLFFLELDKRGVRYLDNTVILKDLRKQRIHGFNQKYDANHWNDFGAFYGTQAMLNTLHEMSENVHVNELNEFSISTTLVDSLSVSKFPINEQIPKLSHNKSITNLYSSYFSELKINKSFPGFGYYVNEIAELRDTPKFLIFQGSYMNGHGAKYMQNAFKEYIHVHDYQNVLDFPYYFNIFQPECVVFEVAEYTFSNNYFNLNKMKTLDYNPSLIKLEKNEVNHIDVSTQEITINEGNTLTTIMWNTESVYSYVWIGLDNIYDMLKTDSGYQATIETKRFKESKDSIKIYTTDIDKQNR